MQVPGPPPTPETHVVVVDPVDGVAHGPNPFLNEYQWTAYNIFKTVVCVVFLLPFRILLLLLAILIVLVIGAFARCFWWPGKTDRKQPPAFGRVCLCFALRLIMLAGGVWHVSVKDERPNKKECCSVVVSNHISFLDVLVLGAFFGPSIVAKKSMAKAPVFGILAHLAQCIFVDRDDPDSRARTRVAIEERARTPGYPPLLIFPEGTCTNGSCFISFRPGAFNPGVPVQPVLLEYSYRYLNPSSRGAGCNLLLLMLQFANHVKLTILPPYLPSKEEVDDAVLFGNNVREVLRSRKGAAATSGPEEDTYWFELAKQHPKTMG